MKTKAGGLPTHFPESNVILRTAQEEALKPHCKDVNNKTRLELLSKGLD